MSTLAVEVVYRGIFQKSLARNIVRSIVFAARKDGKIGTAFGRYGDSPERNGIPAKQFAIVADWLREELEENLAVYEASTTWTSPSTSTTPCAKASNPGPGTGCSPSTPSPSPTAPLIVTSRQEADALHGGHPSKGLSLQPVRGYRDVPASPGLWVYKDDHTDVRLLGALCKVCPQLVSLEIHAGSH